MPDYDLGTARGRIDLDASSLGRAQAALRTTGLGLIALGGAAVAGFAYAVKSAADFEKIISAVGAVTGATEKQMDQLREKALDLATGSIFSADQIATSFEDLGKAGITIPEILNGAAEAVVHLAHAAGDELPGGVAQGAEIIANAMKTFEVGADQAEHFADVLVAAAASSTTSVDDMATTFRYAGPIAHELGLSIDDLATVVALLGDRGIKGSTAGTSLRGVLLSLTPTSKKAASQMKELGLITKDGTNRFYDLQGNLKPIPEVMQILGDATKNLSQQQKVQAFNTIFQRRAMNAALIMADAGAAGFGRYADAIAKLDASTIAAKKLDNLHGDMTILKNTVDALIIRIGLPFQEMLRGWVQALTGVVTWLSKLDPQLVTNIVQIVAIAGAVVAAAGGMLLLFGAVLKLYRLWVEFKVAIGLVSAAMKLLTVSFLTNPVFLFVAAVAALIGILYLAYKRSDEFRARVDGALRALQPAFEAVVRFAKNFADGFMRLVSLVSSGKATLSGVAGIIDDMFGGTGKLEGPIKTVVGVLKTLASAAKDAFDYFADKILPVLWDFSITVGKAVGDAVMWFIKEGIPAIKRFASAVIGQLGKAVDWVSRNVLPIFTELGSLIAAVIDRIIRVVNFFWPAFKAAWAIALGVLRAAWAVIKTIVQSLIILWNNFGDNIVDAIKLAWNTVKTIVETALRIIKGIIQVVTGIISGDWSKVWEGIKNVLGAVWEGIKSAVGLAIEFIKLLISTGLDLIKSLWQIGWNALKDALGIVWELIKTLVGAAITALKDLIINGITLAKDTAVSIFNSLVDFVTGLPGKLMDAASGLWDWVTDGLDGLLDSVVSAFETAVNSVIDIMNIAIRAYDALPFVSADEINPVDLDGSNPRKGGVAEAASKGTKAGAEIVGRSKPSGKVGSGALYNPPSTKKWYETPAKSSTARASGASTAPRAQAKSNVTNVNYDMSGSKFGSSPDEVKGAVTDKSVLNKLTRAVNSGVGERV